MILVTGGAGFIGSNLVSTLNQAGYQVVVCDRLRKNDKWRNLAKTELEAFVAPEDLKSFLNETQGDLKGIVHMGAISSTTETDGDLVIHSNFSLSRSLWLWCAKHGVRFIYASSAATYGDGSAGFDDDWSLEALSQLRPLNLYGWSKHVFDRWVVRQVYQNRLHPEQWVGLKFFNVYGPNEYHKGPMRSVVVQLFEQISTGAPARLFKSYRADYAHGAQERDFVYVKDCVNVVCWLLEHPSVCGIFNIGTGQARTFADLAQATMRAIGIEPNVEFVEMPDHLRERYQYHTQARIDRLRTVGYEQPFTNLEEGVSDYVKNYLTASDKYA